VAQLGWGGVGLCCVACCRLQGWVCRLGCVGIWWFRVGELGWWVVFLHWWIVFVLRCGFGISGVLVGFGLPDSILVWLGVDGLNVIGWMLVGWMLVGWVLVG